MATAGAALRSTPGTGLWSGLPASQAALALLHFPVRLHDGAAPEQLLSMVTMPFVIGPVIALV